MTTTKTRRFYVLDALGYVHTFTQLYKTYDPDIRYLGTDGIEYRIEAHRVPSNHPRVRATQK